MAKIYVRMIVLVAFILAVAWALNGGTWGPTICVLLIGIYIEFVGLRDHIELKAEVAQNSLLRVLPQLFRDKEGT